MLKRVCDFCGRNEVTDRFKIKQLRNVDVGCGQPVDSSVGIPPCPFYRFPDVKDGVAIPHGCKLLDIKNQSS